MLMAYLIPVYTIALLFIGVHCAEEQKKDCDCGCGGNGGKDGGYNLYYPSYPEYPYFGGALASSVGLSPWVLLLLAVGALAVSALLSASRASLLADSMSSSTTSGITYR